MDREAVAATEGAERPAREARARAGGAAGELLALQQTAGNRAVGALLRRRKLQRVVELRPPGRGEASAFDRVDEMVTRINGQTPGVLYRLNGRRLEYEVLFPDEVQNFDTKMMGFIDRAEVVPMRLITNEGLVDGQRLLIDSLQLAYVDLDDMLACDDLSFQLNLIHFLEERFAVRNYERRIGTDMGRDFPSAHARGLRAETEHLRTVVGDPTIEFVFEEDQGNGRVVFGYRSRAERYRIFHVFRPGGRGVQGGEVFVQTRDRRRITIEQLIEERRAAAAAAAPAAPAPAPAAP
jgi:hypothetical protein